MANTTIYYNGRDPFIGLGPTPFVSRTENFIQVGERLTAQETLTLRGVLTGVCEFNSGGSLYSQFTSMVAGAASPQLQLFKNFASDFKTFEILDDGGIVFSRDLVQVTSINFPDNNYGAINPYLPYEITLQSYPNDIPGGRGWNVLQPVHELTFETQEDATVTISETLSAQGLNTATASNNALDNAIDWVNTYDCNVLGGFGTLPDETITTACLRTVGETINRYAGTYERRNTYVYDPLNPGEAGILRYTVTYSYSEAEGISTIEVNGTIEGCRGATPTESPDSLQAIRGRYSNFDPFSVAITTKFQITNNPNLNPNPTSKKVTEDSTKLKISFSFTYNDDMRDPISFDYRCTFNYDIENDVVSATIEGDCTTRLYNTAQSKTDFPVANDLDGTNQKWQQLSQFADGVSLFGKLQIEYNKYLQGINKTYGQYPLNPYYTSFSRTNNYLDWKISLSSNYRSQPAFLPNGFRKFDVSINVTPSLDQFKEFPCLDGMGQYMIFDLNYATRANCTIQANGTILPGTDADAALTTLKNQITVLENANFPGGRPSLDGQQFTKTTTSSKVNVSATATYSAEGVVFSIGGASGGGGNGGNGGLQTF